MVSVQYLWDLFEKCQGDANWMMNLLLNESGDKHGDPGTEEDDFICDCETSGWGTAESPESVIVEEEEEQQRIITTKEPTNRPLPHRQRRKPISQRQLEAAELIKRQIEESVVIGEEFYTANMKRVREWKAKKRNPATVTTSEETEASSSVTSPPEMEEDDDNEPDSEEDKKVRLWFFNLSFQSK